MHAALVAVASALCILYLTSHGPVRYGAVVLASLVPALTLAAQLATGRLAKPRPWLAVLVAMTLLTAHNVIALVQVSLQGQPTATGPAALLTLPAGYVALLAGAAMIAFPYARRDLGGIIDAVAVSLGVASLVWIVGLHPVLMSQHSPTGTRAYTLVVILLVSSIGGAVARARITSAPARPALDYLLLAVALTLAGNIVAAVTRDPVGGVGAWWIGVIWIVGYLALAAAAWHPAQRHLGDVPVPTAGRLTGRRLVFLGVVQGLNPTVAGIVEATGREADWLLLTIVTVLLVPLVLVRIGGLARLHADAVQRLSHLASHDELTGLANRRTLMTRLGALLDAVDAGESPGAVVVFLDLDDLKTVNDQHGHGVGDELLVTVGQRLLGAVRTVDTVARLGGDEFVVVCEGAPEEVRPRTLTAIELALAHPVALDGVLLPCRASVGASEVRPGDRISADALLSAADGSMYEHKRRVRADRQRRREQTHPGDELVRAAR